MGQAEDELACLWIEGHPQARVSLAVPTKGPKAGSQAAARDQASVSLAGAAAPWFLVFFSYSESMWPIEARNAAIANHCFTCAINRVGKVSPQGLNLLNPVH